MTNNTTNNVTDIQFLVRRGNGRVDSMLLRALVAVAFVAPFVSSTCEPPERLPNAGQFFSSSKFLHGTTVDYVCDPGYDILGNQRRTCQSDGRWLPRGVPFCVTDIAKGKTLYAPSFFSKVTKKSRPADKGCTSFKTGRTHFWYLDLEAVYRVQVVRLDFGNKTPPAPTAAEDGNASVINIDMWIGDSVDNTDKESLCSRFDGPLPYGRSLYVPCVKTLRGSYVNVKANSTKPVNLSVCTVQVFSDQAVPVGERTPPTTLPPTEATETSIVGGEFFSYPLTKKFALIVGVGVAAAAAGFFAICMVAYLVRSVCGKRRRDGKILNEALTPASSSRLPFVVAEPKVRGRRLRSSSEPTLRSMLARSSTRYQRDTNQRGYGSRDNAAFTSETTEALVHAPPDVPSTSAEVTLPLSETSTKSHQVINYRESCLL